MGNVCILVRAYMEVAAPWLTCVKRAFMDFILPGLYPSTFHIKCVKFFSLCFFWKVRGKNGQRKVLIKVKFQHKLEEKRCTMLKHRCHYRGGGSFKDKALPVSVLAPPEASSSPPPPTPLDTTCASSNIINSDSLPLGSKPWGGQ